MGNDTIKYSPDWWIHRCKTQYTNKELNSKFVIVDEIGLALQNVDILADKTSPHYILHISIDPNISPIERQEIIDYLDIPLMPDNVFEKRKAIGNKQKGLLSISRFYNYLVSKGIVYNTIEVYNDGLQVIDTCQFLILYLDCYYSKCTRVFEKVNGLVDGFEEYLRNFNYEYFKPKEYNMTALNLFKLLSNVEESEKINYNMLYDDEGRERDILPTMTSSGIEIKKTALYLYADKYPFPADINKWLKSEYGYYTHLASKLLELVPKNKLAMVYDTELVEFIADLSTAQLKIRDFLSERGYTYSLYRFKWNEEKQQVELVGTIK